MDFEFEGFYWRISLAGAVAFSNDYGDQSLTEELIRQHPKLSSLSLHQLSSWIVARINAICMRSFDGTRFEDDSDEITFQLRLRNREKKTLGVAAIHIRATSITFKAASDHIEDIRPFVVNLLTSDPDDLARCEMIVKSPESRQMRRYGWNGDQLIAF